MRYSHDKEIRPYSGTAAWVIMFAPIARWRCLGRRFSKHYVLYYVAFSDLPERLTGKHGNVRGSRFGFARQENLTDRRIDAAGTDVAQQGFNLVFAPRSLVP